ncbi:MAG: NADH-ubiquinone oxidoreductase-F iron-sulfur binding region domain-containing protein [Desulfobulbaceae bacterium]|nr:NADH-ubiquinone oxidoreductase-F iron-sulfur binding region domain-containing protein [Desulfobulbaceae bacterium]
MTDMSELVLFKNRRPDKAATFEEYRQSGGYEALTAVVGKLSPKDVQQQVLDAGLKGRGGAGFPAGRKWAGVPETGHFPRYILPNTDEMEPGTFKDRILVNADPHLVLEGIILTAYAVSAEKGIFFIRPSYEHDAELIEQELEVARQANFLGKNILGSTFSFDLVVHRSGGRYICGEASAQINAIQGRRPNPRKGGPHMAEQGLWKKPTIVNNVETLACVPGIIRHGAAWFKGLSATPTGAGTKLYCVSGMVQRPDCYELPIGTRLSEIIDGSAGGLSPGSTFKACLPGGASTSFMPKQFIDVEMDFDPLKKIGHRLGTGAIMVFDQNTCLVAATINLIEYFARESCGWCTPCREGLPFILELLRAIECGEGKEEYIPLLRRMAGHMNHAYCAFAPGAVQPVYGLLNYFEEEIREHISQKKCPFGVVPQGSCQTVWANRGNGLYPGAANTKDKFASCPI